MLSVVAVSLSLVSPGIELGAVARAGRVARSHVGLSEVPDRWKRTPRSAPAAPAADSDLRWKGTDFLLKEIGSLQATLAEKTQEAATAVRQLVSAQASLKDVEMDFALEAKALKQAEQEVAQLAAEKQELSASLAATDAVLHSSTAEALRLGNELSAAETRNAELDAAYAAEERKAATLAVERGNLAETLKAKAAELKESKSREVALAADLASMKSTSIFGLLRFGIARDASALGPACAGAAALCQRLGATVSAWVDACAVSVGATVRACLAAVSGVARRAGLGSAAGPVPSRWTHSPEMWNSSPRQWKREPEWKRAALA